MTKGASQLRIRRLEVRVASGAQQIYCHLRGVACIRTCGKRDEYERSGGLMICPRRSPVGYLHPV
jgi:hypothetical protein